MPRKRNKFRSAECELIACAWLLSQGYEVYRNVSQYGPIDIVALKEGVFYKINAKTCVFYKGKSYFNPLPKAEIKAGIVPLYVLKDNTCVFKP